VLSQAGVPFTERDLAREPLSEAEIRTLLRGRPSSTLYSRRGRQNKLLGLDPDRMTDDEMIAAMAHEPRLIRRPTLLIDDELLPRPSRSQLAVIVREGHKITS
jgi:arsenate reductase-like glutaredoxin family protein